MFEESGILTGVALNEDGQEQAGMGVAVADYDEDGLFDLIKTNFADDTPNLYHNNGDGTFTDNVYLSGLGIHTQFLGWGVHFLDVDCDGLEDVLIVNGHVYPEVDQANLSTYRQQRLFYWNVGKGRFVDLSEKAGPGITDALVVARLGAGGSRQRRLARGRHQQHRRAAEPAQEFGSEEELAAGLAGRNPMQPGCDRGAGLCVHRRAAAFG